SMACGCPAIVSDISSNMEWVHDGVEGWVFKDGNSDSLAQKIITAYDNRKALKKFKNAARLKAEKDADWKQGIQKLLDTYQIFNRVTYTHESSYRKSG
ncbi:MAG: glycosyltransferase, partial [Anaerolineaceae bacterium]|nr:glycosyltransferase [Anaerolineaceae bacterium]